jgi:hypothetical protein
MIFGRARECYVLNAIDFELYANTCRRLFQARARPHNSTMAANVFAAETLITRRD